MNQQYMKSILSGRREPLVTRLVCDSRSQCFPALISKFRSAPAVIKISLPSKHVYTYAQGIVRPDRWANHENQPRSSAIIL